MNIETLTFERGTEEAAIVMTDTCAVVYQPGVMRWVTKYLYRAISKLESQGYSLQKTRLPYGTV